jgi:hypothetical protein
MSGRGGHRACRWRRAIVTLPHVIRRQVIEVDVATDAGASDLLDRIGELNQARFVPVIERVLAEFDRPGVVINIDRIDLKLGTFSPHRLEPAAERLEGALRDALLKAFSAGIHIGAAMPGTGGRASTRQGISVDAVTAGTALLRSLTRYLLHGVWPYRHEAAGNPTALLTNLVNREPAVLLQMINRHRDRPEFIGRLAMQMPFADLARLLDLMQPEHAATILATLLKLQETHRTTPLAPHGDRSMARLLWQLVLQNVLNVTGAAFDRIGFEQRLLQGIAAAQASGDSKVLRHAVAGGITIAGQATRISESANLRTAGAPDFPVAPDIRQREDAEPARLDPLELFLLRGTLPGGSLDALLIELIHDQPDALARLLRRHARNDAMSRRMAEILNPATLDRLLTLLTPEAAAIIVAHMLEVRELHRVKPVVPLSDRSLQRLLWFIALRYVLNEAGSQFNRRSFVESLIGGIANAERLTYQELLSALHAGVTEIAKTIPVATSLPTIIIDLAGSFERTRLRSSSALETGQVASIGGKAPEARVVALRNRPDEAGARAASKSEKLDRAAASMQAEPDRELDRQTEANLAELVAGYGDLDRLRHLLATGVLPWRDILAEPGLTPQRLIEALGRLRPGVVRIALGNAPPHRVEIRRAIDAMPDATVTALIRLLLPREAGGQELLQAVISYTAGAADPRRFQAALIAALVEGSALDFEALAAAGDGHAGDASVDHASADLAETLLASLADGVGGGAGTDTQWTGTLARLLASNTRAARRFIATAAKSPAALARMTELCEPPLLDRVLAALAPAAAATLTALARAVIAESSRHGIHHRDIVAAFLAEVATIDADAAPSAGLILRLLRRLFGARQPPWLVAMLRRDLLPHLPSGAATALSVMLAAPRQAMPAETSSSEPRGPLSLESGRDFRHGENAAKALAPFNPQPGEPQLARGDDASSTPVPGQHAEWLFRALADCDLSRAAARDEVPELLQELMNELLETPSRDLAIRLVTFLSQARNAGHLIRLLPERQLARLIVVAVPDAGAGQLEAGEVLAEAAGAAGLAIDRSVVWQALFNTVVAPAGERTLEHLAERFFAMAGRVSSDADPARRDAAGVALLTATVQRARDAGQAALVMALEKRRGVLAAAYADGRHAPAGRAKPSTRPAAPRENRATTAFRLESDDIAGEPIYIGNAGLVLANPFLPHLFDTLGLLRRDEAGKPRLRDEAAASRAVHLLQYLVDGRTDRPEPLLVLNKIICGMPVAAPVEREIEVTELERETCDTLLRSIVENWPILRNTSIAGLQETFLQREGKLTYGEAGWRLQVQRKTLDVLVDQVPWSIGVVFHAWMPGALHVTW